MIIGITGGIGSGKSTVLKILKELDQKTLSCDEVSRILTRKNGRALPKIEQEFHCVHNGMLDREALASIVFTDANKREKLNSIMHPLIYDEIVRKTKKGTWYVEIPLLYETNFEKNCEKVWVCICEDRIRKFRIKDRDNMSDEEILQRMQSQLTDGERLERSPDLVINTNCSLSRLKEFIQENI